MRKIFLLSVITLILLGAGTYIWALRFAEKQGLSQQELSSFPGASIVKDQLGVLHISANRWENAVEAQGFATASERLFQMDLMRRKADGALSEMVGASALDFDKKQRAQDWRHYVSQNLSSLPEDQKSTCDAYAKGVNSFIRQYPNRWGIEYAILRSKPKSWDCTDTMLIALLMADNMSRSWQKDLDLLSWKKVLPDEWFNFAFPLRHPWNHPFFGDPSNADDLAHLPASMLPKTNIAEEDYILHTDNLSPSSDGSNSWAYRGKKGAWLANDPHLGYQVPQLWMPTKLSFADGRWVVGTALPGTPGILIGMNNDITWAITSTGEDVDDAVIEDNPSAIVTEKSEIKIHGQESQFIDVKKSPRGPIVSQLSNGDLIARQWIALKPGILSLPSQKLDFSTNWESFNSSIDDFKFVPLNFTMLDKLSNMGLRVSGCDIARKYNGDFATTAENSTWDTPCPVSSRRRIMIPFDNGNESAFISTANERLWWDEQRHNWADDDRALRIKEKLGQSDQLSLDDMRLLQLDTTSKFHRELLQWLLKYGHTSFLTTAQKQEWINWDGNSKACPICMTESVDASFLFDQIITRKIVRQFSLNNSSSPVFHFDTKRSRVVRAIENPSALESLGISPEELATGILQKVARVPSKNARPWQNVNQWTAQHPFVGRIPVLGQLFALSNSPQFGSSATVRAEKPMHGPSTRIIWNPKNPEASIWSFPTGTSGHIASPLYANWLEIWQSGGMSQVPL